MPRNSATCANAGASRQIDFSAERSHLGDHQFFEDSVDFQQVSSRIEVGQVRSGDRLRIGGTENDDCGCEGGRISNVGYRPAANNLIKGLRFYPDR